MYKDRSGWSPHDTTLQRSLTGQVAQRVREVGEGRVCTSILVAAELRFGAARKGSELLASQLESIFGAIEVLPFEAPA